MTTFVDLGLSDETLKALDELGYKTPTPIQEKAIPVLLMGRDVLGCAQTGTGKTASFTLPMIEILSSGTAKAMMPRSIVLAPTRELAMQVADNFTQYTKHQSLSMALLIGGVHTAEQSKVLAKGVDVLIATPGRLMDFLERGEILPNDVKMLVIDEADRMLDMGFIPDIEKIVSMMPTLRQTVMFSATMPTEIQKLANTFLMNPKEIKVATPSSTAQTVSQHLCNVHPKGKINALEKLLDSEKIDNAVIFCNRKADVSSLCKTLQNDGYSAGSLHGDMNQYKRMATLQDFKDNKIKMLICSDVAARGLDIPTVSHVFNYDLPTNPEDYVHRIGRTGRAGRSGTAFAFATMRDKKLLEAIEKTIGKSIPEYKSDEKSSDKKQKPNPKDKPKINKDKPENKKGNDHKSEYKSTDNKKDDRKKNHRNKKDDDFYIESLPNIEGKFADSDQVPYFLTVSAKSVQKKETPKPSTTKAKKVTAKKSTAKKSTAKKAIAKKASAKKTSAKKTSVKKATAKE